MRLHPVVEAAARGELPSWARAGEPRLEHMARVAGLMEQWARQLGFDAPEVTRWRAGAFLHDVLRDAPVKELEAQAPPEFRRLDGRILHGPVAARRLREVEGVTDQPLLDAVAFHTLGHPEFGELGRALFAADFLDPGRPEDDGWRQSLRERMPQERGAVVRAVLRARIGHSLEVERVLRPETVAYWNVLVEEAGRG